MEEILRMEHITKKFGEFYANRDINLSVQKGEVHTLLGENGAGKSTLMNILFGLYQPTAGQHHSGGSEHQGRLHRQGRPEEGDIGAVPEVWAGRGAR